MAITYAAFSALSEYLSKYAGASILAVIVDESDPTQVIVSQTTGISNNEQFEIIPIEEAGSDGVDEIVQGRHSGTISVPLFWTPQRNDALPTRQTFIGKSYVVIAKVAKGRPGEDNVVNAFVGCKLSDNSTFNVGARGAVTGNLSFGYTRRYNGTEWAVLTGA